PLAGFPPQPFPPPFLRAGSPQRAFPRARQLVQRLVGRPPRAAAGPLAGFPPQPFPPPFLRAGSPQPAFPRARQLVQRLVGRPPRAAAGPLAGFPSLPFPPPRPEPEPAILTPPTSCAPAAKEGCRDTP